MLDEGCGPGYEGIRIAAIAGKTGKVTGIDVSERKIAIADVKAKGSGLPVSFRTGDVRTLPFPNTVFDAVRIECTLRIPDTPGQVLNEMVRLLCPGGRLLSIDWEMEFCNSPEYRNARELRKSAADGELIVPEGFVPG